MSGRNDPCHCGSGKKYKKCCAGKVQAAAAQESGFGRFLTLKMTLRMKLDLFLDRKHPRIPFEQIKRSFFKEMDAPVPSEMKDTIFQFYLHFFYRFNNNKRAVEWLMDEEAHKLDVNERNLLEQWCEMVPHLLECVEHVEKGIMVKDKLTGEMFLMGKDPNPHSHYIHPWSVTFGMIEEFDGAYYLNGVMLWAPPGAAVPVYDELVSMDEVSVFKNYPRLLALFLKESSKPPIPVIPVKENQIKLTYSAPNWDVVKRRLTSSKWFSVDGEYVLLSDDIVYMDSLLPSPLVMNQILAKAVFKGKELVFHSPVMKHADAFEKKMEKLGIAQVSKRVEVKTYDATIKSTGLDYVFYYDADDELPDYFMLFAQKKLLQETESEIFSLGAALKDLSPEKADLYLKQLEHLSSSDMHDLYTEAGVTEDFNTVRKELNLPFSPFVTGGAKRKTSLASNSKRKKNARDDQPFFYSDFAEFFDLKTAGKTKATANKYQASLDLIGMCIHVIEAESWDEIGPYEWEEMVFFQYFNIADEPSVHQAGNFLSVLLQFVKFQDTKRMRDFGFYVKDVIDEHKPYLLDAVKLRSRINPEPHNYLQQAYVRSLNGIPGIYAFEKVLSKSVKVRDLASDKMYTITLPADIVQEKIAHPGMVLLGEIIQTSKTVYKFISADRVFTRAALPYLAES